MNRSKPYLQELTKNETFELDTLKDYLRHIPPGNFTKKDDEDEECDDYENIEKDYENIEKVKKIGFITLDKKNNSSLENLPVYACKTTKKLSERSAKKEQYNLAKELLDKKFDAGIFVFYDDKGSFRFSLVVGTPKGKNIEYSSFKRYTYYVNKELENKTFIQQLGKPNFKTLENIKEAFSVEKVTKEFYDKIEKWYQRALSNCKFPPAVQESASEKKMSIIRLITRMLFIWFMRERKLVPATLFKENTVNQYLEKHVTPNESNYYKAILQNLFFAILNTNHDNRSFRSETRGRHGFNTDFNNHSKCRFQELFKKDYQGDGLKKVFSLANDPAKPIPFLNGGLFECLDDGKNDKYIDGFTERSKKYQATVPNHLFFQDDEKQPGLINILASYNFTIDENTPGDAEIALDPELLGRVFENLLAKFNPETEEISRKNTGSFYTPREIVNYMVDESLKQYFSEKNNKAKLFPQNNLRENLNRLFQPENKDNPFSKEQSKQLVQWIHELRILDPAVGSGAFPMGILNRLVHLLEWLDKDNEIWKQMQLTPLEKMPDSGAKKTAIKAVENYFEKNTHYGRKLFLIKNCIFGVDIQEIAIEIARLRFFISLLVDEKIDETQKTQGIEPLPNLDFKLIKADALPFVQDDQILHYGLSKKINDIAKLEDEFFSQTDDKVKKSKKSEAQEAIENLKKEFKGADLIIHFAQLLQEQKTINHVFDIVIGNPPYVQLQKNSSSLAKKYQNSRYQVFNKRGDIYCLFYERALHLAKKHTGIVSFITSNKWMRAGYGEKLRKFLAEKNCRNLLDLGGQPIFESVTVDTNILIINNRKSKNELAACSFPANFKKDTTDINRHFQQNKISRLPVSADTWFIGTNAEVKLKEKIEQLGKPLGKWDIKINYGIKTGYNDAFIIDGAKKDELIAADPQCAEVIKPILRGKDIHRYKASFADKWLLFIPWHFPLHKDSMITGASKKAEKAFQNNYPVIYNHLLKYKDKLQNRNKAETGIRYEWYALQRCAATYYEEFAKEKIVWQRITQKPFFTYVKKNFFVLDSSAFLSSFQERTGKYILSILNSKISYYWISKNVSQLGAKGFIFANQYVEKMFVPDISPKEQQPFIDLANAIIKKNAQNHDTTAQEAEVDKLVYQLYQLTPSEIELIEKQ